MSGTGKRVRPGDPMRIPASAFNRWQDAADAFQRNRWSMGGDQLPVARQSEFVTIRNDTGDDLDQFSIVGLDAPLILPSANLERWKVQRSWSAVAPTKAGYRGKIAVTLRPIAADAYGIAQVHGDAVVNVRGTQGTKRFADIIDNDTSALEFADSGVAEVVWAATDTGAQAGDYWTVVRLNPCAATASAYSGPFAVTPRAGYAYQVAIGATRTVPGNGYQWCDRIYVNDDAVIEKDAPEFVVVTGDVDEPGLIYYDVGLDNYTATPLYVAGTSLPTEPDDHRYVLVARVIQRTTAVEIVGQEQFGQIYVSFFAPTTIQQGPAGVGYGGTSTTSNTIPPP